MRNTPLRMLGAALAMALAFLGTAPQTYAATSAKKSKYLESGVYRIKKYLAVRL